MDTIFQTQTGSTDAVAPARQAFINAELTKVGGNMDALVQKYKIVDNIIEDWVEYKAWEGLVDFYMGDHQRRISKGRVSRPDTQRQTDL